MKETEDYNSSEVVFGYCGVAWIQLYTAYTSLNVEKLGQATWFIAYNICMVTTRVP
jgi:hypothetical protein